MISVVSVLRELLREHVWGSVEVQLLATVLVVVALVLTFRLVRGLRAVLGERYTANFAEAVEMTTMAVEIGIAAYLLADIWALGFLVEQAVDDFLLNRWILVRATVALAVFLTGYLLVRVVNRIFDSLWKERIITQHQKEVGYHVVDAAIIVIAALFAISVWGDNPSNVLIGAGVLSAVLGLAARQTVAAAISGYALLLTRPFRAGDWIEVATDQGERTSGIVQDVTLLHTTVRTFNDEHVLVPNTHVTTNRVTNHMRNDRLRIDVEVDVDYDTDLAHARSVLAEVGSGLEIRAERDPRAVVKRFDDSAIVLELQIWIENPTRDRVWTARTDAIAAIATAFDQEDITIPFPQRTHQPRTDEGFRVDATREPSPATSD